MLRDVARGVAETPIVDGLVVHEHLALDVHLRDALQPSCQQIHLHAPYPWSIGSGLSARGNVPNRLTKFGQHKFGNELLGLTQLIALRDAQVLQARKRIGRYHRT